jgi:hypothetical protein
MELPGPEANQAAEKCPAGQSGNPNKQTAHGEFILVSQRRPGLRVAIAAPTSRKAPPPKKARGIAWFCSG